MPSTVKNFIEYSGISELLPNIPTAFKEINVQESVHIPNAKANIEQIAKIIADVVITNTVVITTPVVTSLEGQVLTGWKVVIEGELRETIEYISDELTQPVHAVHFNVPFGSCIILPQSFNCGTKVTVNAYIEDIFIEKLDNRSFFKNICLLLVAEF